MSTQICVLCGQDVEEYLFHEIKATLFCERCCEKVSEADDKKLCSTVRAMNEFGCRRSDLQQLQWLCRSNTHSRSLAKMRFYLTAEVRHIGAIARSSREQKESLKRDTEQEQCGIKRQKLATKYRVLVHEIRPILRPFVLGDYLQSSRSKTLLRDVRQRYFLKDRAYQLVESCKAHPLSALDFCMGHPKGTTETYLELRESMRKVFFVEGNKIMEMLSFVDRERLNGTPLEDVLLQFQNPDTKAILFMHLEEKVGTATAKQIMSHSACQQRINRGGEVTQVAEKLLAFWRSKNNKKQRRFELKNALKARCLVRNLGCTISEDYIKGKIDVDLDEVVGAIDIHWRLWCISPLVWSNYSSSCQEEFRRCLLEEQLSLDESVNIAMMKTRE